MCDHKECESVASHLNSLDCWDYSIELECLRGPEDLQLAAELGKTLLERNKELEINLKQHQNIIEDQTQEIEYLTKQTVALREVNDSRLRIYEQLEVSIHDLERANHRLAVENAADKKQIKSLCTNIDALEAKCEELQSTIDELRLQLDSYKRKCQQKEAEITTPVVLPRLKSEVVTVTKTEEVPCIEVQNDKEGRKETQEMKMTTSDINISDNVNTENDLITQLTTQLHELKNKKTQDQKRMIELEEQISMLVQENQELEYKLVAISTKDENMKSMHEEFTTLDEVRQGQLCSHCLRNIDDRIADDLSILDPEEEDDDSMIDALASDAVFHSSAYLYVNQDDEKHDRQSELTQNKSNNLYRDLVEKYEALVAVNRNHNSGHNMSLHEELQMSNYHNAHSKDTDEESGHGDSMNIIYEKQCKISKERKTVSHTPSDFSEAETSSSGFADETSNKSTQTDGRPGSFLCTIADGEDCKFSIYDDASPIDSRFRNRPEYRELFKEIFTVLKKAAENKDEGEELPLLDDCIPITHLPKVPPVTPATENFPKEFTDDNQSVTSSAMSEDSVSLAEPATVVEKLTPESNVEQIKENKETTSDKTEKAPVLTPYKREPLEYISVAVNVRKKSSKRNTRRQFNERSDSPVLPLSPRISYLSNSSSQRKRKDNIRSVGVDNNQVWNGTTLQFWSSNRNTASPTPSQTSNRSLKYDKNNMEFKPSTASHDLHKLKRLDLSYAEVLRNASNKKRECAKSFSKPFSRK